MRIAAIASRITTASLGLVATTVLASTSVLAQPSPDPVSSEDPLGEGPAVDHHEGAIAS